MPLEENWFARLASTLNQWTTPDDPVEIAMDAEPSDTSHQAAPEKPLRVTASGLAPDCTVRVTVYSLPRALGNVTADEEGRVDARGCWSPPSWWLVCCSGKCVRRKNREPELIFRNLREF